MKFKNILCPIDYSDASLAALDHGARLGRHEDATLHILNVYELIFADTYVDGMAPMPVSPDVNALKKRLTNVRPEKVKTVHELIFGIPATSIIKYARAKNIDLIVMGTRSTSKLERWLIGSVTESVIRSAPCPVLAIHEKTNQAAKLTAEPSVSG